MWPAFVINPSPTRFGAKIDDKRDMNSQDGKEDSDGGRYDGVAMSKECDSKSVTLETGYVGHVAHASSYAVVNSNDRTILSDNPIDEHSTTLTARVPVFVDVVEAKYLLIPEDPSKVQKRRRGLTGKHLGLSPI